MPRPHKNLLRTLTTDEQNHLEHLARSHTHPAIIVARAKSLLAVTNGMNFNDAAKNSGRKSGDAVANLVARFNTESLDALHSRHGGGYTIKYTPEQRNRILEEVRLLAPHQHLRAWAAAHQIGNWMAPALGR
jgi:transposase